jgi:hypothetical protein
MKFGVAVKANHTNFHIDELLYKRVQSGLGLLTIRIEDRGIWLKSIGVSQGKIGKDLQYHLKSILEESG